jgi:cysteine desulfurase/selenocysteine lyase
VGHHCAWPGCRAMDVPATTRMSTYIYNGLDDVDDFLQALGRVRQVFGAH